MPAGVLGAVGASGQKVSGGQSLDKRFCGTAARRRDLPDDSGWPEGVQDTGQCAPDPAEDRPGHHAESGARRHVGLQSVAGTCVRAFAYALRHGHEDGVRIAGDQAAAWTLYAGLQSN